MCPRMICVSPPRLILIFLQRVIFATYLFCFVDVLVHHNLDNPPIVKTHTNGKTVFFVSYFCFRASVCARIARWPWGRLDKDFHTFTCCVLCFRNDTLFLCSLFLYNEEFACTLITHTTLRRCMNVRVRRMKKLRRNRYKYGCHIYLSANAESSSLFSNHD